MARKRKRRFDARAKAAFVGAVEQGASVAAAARAAGFCVSTVYSARARCALFRQAWDEAAESSSAPVLFARRGGRVQRIRVRRRIFDDRLKAEFLEHFAGSCNIAAAAEAAGVGRSTVNKHLVQDPRFRAAFDETADLARGDLEAEAVRARLAGFDRPVPIGERPGPDADENWDRTLQLLREHRRGRARRAGRAPAAWSFERSLDALERELAAFGVRIDREEADG
jgi:hypothetical protein